MKIVVSFLFLIITLFANDYKINDTIDRFSFVDQFDNVKTIDNQSKMIIYLNSSTIDIFSDYVTHNAKLLNNKLIVIYNVCDFIPFIFKFYTLPQLQALTFSVRLDYTHKRFIQEDEDIVIYILDNLQITKIIKIQNEKELRSYLSSI